MAPATYVFSYGSLVSPASVRRTLGHDIDGRAFRPCRLAGVRRAWNVCTDRTSHPERTFLHRDGSEFTGVAVVLGLEPGAGCDGALFPVTAHDLDRLDARERNYDRVNVTDRIDCDGGPVDGVVHTYLPRPDAVHRLRAAAAAGREVAVRAGYLRTVEEGFAAIGGLGRYRRTTAPPAVPVLDLRIIIAATAPPVALARRHSELFHRLEHRSPSGATTPTWLQHRERSSEHPASG